MTKIPNRNTPTTLLRVVLLGDHQTIQHMEVLEKIAAQHGAAIAAVFSFEPGQTASCTELSEVPDIVSAVSRALSNKMPIWIPYPKEDLGREQHFRRISLVLQRHGLDLIAGTHLTPCPTVGGMSEVDFALRFEVQAVDNLDRAALAAAGATTLAWEIEAMLSAAAREYGNELPPESASMAAADEEIEVSRPLKLPCSSTPWAAREPALRNFAKWLSRGCGLSQSAVAQCLNLTKHRTPQGLPWRQSTVSALINGRYVRRQ